MTGDWVARPAEHADARASGARGSGDAGSTGSHAAGSWEQGDPWADDDPGATTQWARRDSGSLPQAQHADAWGTGPRRTPREPETESPLSSTGSQPRPVWDSGPQEPVSATGSRPAASSGGQPRYAWESGPQRRVPAAGGLPPSPRESGPQSPVSGTGSQPSAATGGRPRFPWGSGPQRSVPATGPQPATPTGGQPADRAPWESPDWGADSGWGTTTDGAAEVRGAAGDRGAGAAADWGTSPEREDAGHPVLNRGPVPGPGPSRRRPARPERDSHRAAKHGKPGRWRGAGDRPGGES